MLQKKYKVFLIFYLQWIVVVSDVSEADIENAFHYLTTFSEVKRAEEWVKNLYFAIFSIGDFPGPYANPVDESATEKRGQEVRRLLYRGPKKRPHSFVYKVFYRIIAPSAEESEGTIIVDRIIHGSSNWPNDTVDDDEP